MYTLTSEKWRGLSKLSEEMGELQQVLAKIVENGGSLDYWDKDLKTSLLEELGDVAASFSFFVCNNMSDDDLDRICDRQDLKIEKYEEWSDA